MLQYIHLKEQFVQISTDSVFFPFVARVSQRSCPLSPLILQSQYRSGLTCMAGPVSADWRISPRAEFLFDGSDCERTHYMNCILCLVELLQSLEASNETASSPYQNNTPRIPPSIYNSTVFHI